MAQLINWDTCFYTMSNYHFSASQASIWIIVLAAGCLVAYHIFRYFYERKPFMSEDKAEMICAYLIHAAMLLLAGYLIYFIYFFKPDSVQMMIDNMTMTMGSGDLPEVIKMV